MTRVVGFTILNYLLKERVGHAQSPSDPHVARSEFDGGTNYAEFIFNLSSSITPGNPDIVDSD